MKDTIINDYLIKMLIENNFIHSFISNNWRTERAFLKCLEIAIGENLDSWKYGGHFKEVAENAEELLREYILNWKKDSFLAPYRQIVQEFYEFTDNEMAEIAKERGFI